MESPRSPPPPKPFTALEHSTDAKFHLLLACTGSVATIKLPLIASTLSERYGNTLSIHVILTSSAAKFLQNPFNIEGVHRVWTDDDEWSFPHNKSGTWERGDPVLHIELRRWADMMVIAPLSANSMAKVVGGLCDNLLLSVARAWDTTVQPGSAGKKIIVAPAMNTAMWNHPVTAQHIATLEKWEWMEVLRPVEKTLACGDIGSGAMREWQDIVALVEENSGLSLSS
ncbi:uncharacterized protein LAJ45_00474 [Morchella importuna]|uniref:uncharacterized protein n=1 Tax=Morchella importuna TaxID=1174673 RepID=UPI001E8DB19B|nr:uncharacterized protein LAJ45_00474 [Morchella importuna]KAH8155464.1 hypothetical protein LAJ45_00474 [Morchella importuna]